jgi:hypothetical protein
MMRESPFRQPQNYALVMLLLSLLVYSSIGLTMTVSPVQAESLPVHDEPSPDGIGHGLDVTSASAAFLPSP